MKELLQFDYTAVGHVTIDVLDDGTRRPGGSAFYGALQAARLGQRTQIITQGVPREIEELLDPYSAELELRVLPARQTTTLLSSGSGARRTQRVLAWAGPIERVLRLHTEILHLAPVAREGLERWRAGGAFVGLTPQGLLRDSSPAYDRVSLVAPSRASERLAARCNAIVLSRHERTVAAKLLQRGIDSGALVAITAEWRPCTLLLPDGSQLEVTVPAVARPIDDMGAGDVFAAALFIALGAGENVEEATMLASAAAAVRMQGEGARAIGNQAEIRARMRTAGAGVR